MRRHLHIREKFVLVASVCIFVFAGIGGYFLLQIESRLYTEDLIHQGRTVAGITGVIFTNAMVYKELDMVEDVAFTDYLDYYILYLMKHDPRIEYIVVLDNSGRVLSHSSIMEYGRQYADPITLRALEASSILTQRFEKNGLAILDVAAPLSISTKSWGVCRVGLSLNELNTQIMELRYRIGAMTGLFLLAALITIGFLSKKVTAPLVKLSRTMDQITETGDLDISHYTPKPRNDEIGVLQDSFSWMVRRLQTANEERLQTMELAMRAEKMAGIGLLASGVAHEINNPLGGVVLCFNNLCREDMDEASRREHIEVIASGLEKIQQTVKELLDYARESPLSKEPVGINDLVEDSLKLAEYLLKKRDIRIVRQFRSDLPEILVNASKISQVFLNIIINAIHAMGDEGTLTLESGSDGDFCHVRIGDTGPGIDEDVIKKIYDPFFTTKRADIGTGLGLAVSATFVRQHAGVIDVISKKGQGATFVIKLPISDRGSS